LLFTRTKSDKNWPRYGASNTTRSKQDFCPTLADLKSPYTKYITEQSTNQIRQIAMCRPIGLRCVARRNVNERCHAPKSNGCAHALNLFIIEAVASLFDFCDRENVHFISRKAYVTDSRVLRQRILPRYCVFKTCEIYMFDIICDVNVKGVVRSKIGFFKNWICESRRPGRDIAFYPNKIGQKLAEIWGVQYNSLKTRFLSDFS
jgi:hypothetical protein